MELKITSGKEGESVTIRNAKKSIMINSKGGSLVLEITNEYGNSITYEISDNHSFDNLHSSLWQLIKDSQH